MRKQWPAKRPRNRLGVKAKLKSETVKTISPEPAEAKITKPKAANKLKAIKAPKVAAKPKEVLGSGLNLEQNTSMKEYEKVFLKNKGSVKGK